MAAVIHAAWSRDYRARAIIRFDADYLRWFMASPSFFGVWVEDHDQRGVGLVVGVRRTLAYRGKLLPVAYPTLLSVRPEHQGRGVPQNLVAHVDRAAIELLQAHFSVGVFDEGSAGRAVLRRFTAANPGSLLVVTQPITVWGAAYDLRVLDGFEPLPGWQRLSLLPGIRKLVEVPPRHDSLLPASMLMPNPPDATLEHDGGVRFLFNDEFLCHYPCPSTEHAGTVTFALSQEERCVCSYHVVTMCKPGLVDRRLGLIQVFDPGTASTANLVRVLTHMHAMFQRAGCVGAMIHDTAGLPTSVLVRTRFVPMPRQVYFLFRGPKELVEPFAQAGPPFRMDLL